MDSFFGMGTMVVCLKQVATAYWYRGRFNVEVNTSASLLAHPLKQGCPNFLAQGPL